MAKRNTENNDKRSEQLRIWVTPEEIEKIEKAQEENGCPNRSEFVRDAVKFYIGYHYFLYFSLPRLKILSFCKI